MSDEDRRRPLAGDRPIESPDQDTIGRSGFASQIRDEIETTPRDEGLVIAVTGDWGSGKTSVINLALNPLQERTGYRVVRFNPWLFSGTPQLVEHFFGELMAELKASGNTRLKEIGEALERYGATIDPLRFLPGADKAAALSTTLGRILRGPDVAVEELDVFAAGHDPDTLQNKLLEVLGERRYDPPRADGSPRRYRFPRRKATLICQARRWVLAIGSLTDHFSARTCERERRAWLLGCPGLGPKSASWLLRNTGWASELAILDVHVLRAMNEAGIIAEISLPVDYEVTERRFLDWCEQLGATPAVFDLFLWE